MGDRWEEHYATDEKLSARQRMWATSRREPPFELLPWVLERAALAPGSAADVLDVGCGNGRYLAALAERGHGGRRVGADRSFGMLTGIDPAEQRVQLDAQALPFDADSFDVVLAVHMLYHVPEVRLAAAEFRRVLRPGGTFVATTNASTHVAELVSLVESAVGGGWRMHPRAHDHFALDDGGAQLVGAFEQVERIACPAGRVVVEDADAIGDYVATLGDTYREQVDLPWPVVTDRVRMSASTVIERDGQLALTAAVGAFVCR